MQAFLSLMYDHCHLYGAVHFFLIERNAVLFVNFGRFCTEIRNILSFLCFRTSNLCDSFQDFNHQSGFFLCFVHIGDFHRIIANEAGLNS